VATLVLLHPTGPELGRRYSLAGPQLVLGRGVDCAIRVDNESVSRSHARIFHNGDAWVIEDLDSTNGCFVNELRVERSVLHDADCVRIGATIFRFHVTGGLQRCEDDDGGGAAGPAVLVDRRIVA
jgi:two-component system, cell cycle response regulator